MEQYSFLAIEARRPEPAAPQLSAAGSFDWNKASRRGFGAIAGSMPIGRRRAASVSSDPRKMIAESRRGTQDGAEARTVATLVWEALARLCRVTRRPRLFDGEPGNRPRAGSRQLWAACRFHLRQAGRVGYPPGRRLAGAASGNHCGI